MPHPAPDGLPLIGVAADTRTVDDYTWHAVIDIYLHAVVTGSEAIPVIIPAMGPDLDIDALLPRLDGIVLPGSRSNVHPETYGAPADPRAEPHDPSRDAMTLPLARAALRHGVPLFAICRGLQELNVALGGTLHAEVHEVEGRDDHRSALGPDLDTRFAIRQRVDIRPGGVLAEIVGQDSIQVNSLHRQAIDRLAEDLAIEATAPDGTIEAVRVRNATSFALGVQWHPEYWVRTDRPSTLLFNAFGHAARAHRAKRSG